MPSWLVFVIFYIVHGTHTPYSGPINELREACRGYWPAVVLHGYKPVDRENDDDTDLITVGADGQTYLCDYGGRLETRFQGCCGRKTMSSMTKLRARMPAQMLALDRAASAQHRSSNANSLGGQNSAGFPQICATFQRDNLRRHFSVRVLHAQPGSRVCECRHSKMQSTCVINAEVKTLGLQIPDRLLALADEVIE
jgi:hypothetical protein